MDYLKSSLLMSHGVVAQTQFAGSTKGTYVDDLARVGNWPRAQDIKRITKITVYKGAIIDRLVITYQVGDAFVTVQHGGDTGNVQPDINIGNDEKNRCRLWYSSPGCKPLW